MRYLNDNPEQMNRLIACILMAFCLQSNAQNEISSWSDHFSYRPVKHVTSLGQKIIAATDLGAFIHDPEDGSMTRLNKTNKLSDAGISALKGVPELNMILIGYGSGNIDVWIDERVINISDVVTANILADKQINEFYIFDGFAYVCTEFGIIQLDLEKLEIKDTFVIGNQGTFLGVNDLVIENGEIIAASNLGMYKASFPNIFLADFQSWELDVNTPDVSGNYEGLEEFDGYLYTHITEPEGDVVYRKEIETDSAWEAWLTDAGLGINRLDATTNHIVVSADASVKQYNTSLESIKEISFVSGNFPNFNSAIVSPDGDGLWIADINSGLFHASNTSGINETIPNGPDFSDARRINSFFENVWVATGGVDLGFDNNFKRAGINHFDNLSWSSINDMNNEFMTGVNDIGGFILDIMDITINPIDNDQVFASSWEEGLIEIRSGEPVEIYNSDNSPLVSIDNFIGEGVTNIGGITYDDDGNLWVTNSQTDSCLHVLEADGTWNTFEIPEMIPTSVIGDIIVARNNFVWMVLEKGVEGVLVYNYGEDIQDQSDDQYRILTSEEGDGGLPSDDVYSIAEDINGEIWIGTLQGLGIYFNTNCLFEGEECDAQQILIEQDGNFQILLETETITSIEIDGGNRKWIGTQTSGAFLLSDDGIDQINHFTKENSPLLSDNIQDISFNFTTGSIFFATDLGVVSFKGTATGFNGEISESKIYPNPVRETFDGVITIDGLTGETDVRITDINGSLVHSTVSEGGRAIWDGRNESGLKVSTGVYLVFASNQNGKETTVGKIAIVN